MIRFTGALAGAVLAAAVFAPATAMPIRMQQPGAVRAGFERTATREFPALRGALDRGRVSDAMPMHVVVGLGHFNRALVDSILRRQLTPGDALYHHYLTTQETTRYFSPGGRQVAAVARFLAAQGFRNLSVTPDNLLLIGDASAGVASRTFATEIHAYSLGRRAYFANAQPALIPNAMHGMITSVLGLNNFTARPHVLYEARQHTAYSAYRNRLTVTNQPAPVGSTGNATATAAPTAAATAVPCNGEAVGGACTLNEYNAQAIRDAYDVQQNPTSTTNTWGNTAKSTKIALFTEGDMTGVLSDLKLYEKANNLPTVTPIIVHPGIPSPDVSGQDEFDLDTQVSHGITQDLAAMYLYDDTSLTDADTTVGFDRFKTDNLAKAGSASFGICEIFPATDGTLTTEDEIFAEAAVQGQTVFSSSGDNGVTCPVAASTGVPGTGLPAQSYPGVSPYVISVGGTSLFTTTTRNAAGNTYDYELAWSGGGGGVSTEDSSPFWQQGVVPAACQAPSAVPSVDTMKCVPDVAMEADNNLSPAIVYVNGATEGVGGTSLASPLALGVWALLETKHSNGLGFAGPLLYGMYEKYTTKNATTGMYTAPTPAVGAMTQAIGGFHDTFLGSNGTPALPGYDTTNGVGSFDVQLSITDIPTSYAHGP